MLEVVANTVVQIDEVSTGMGSGSSVLNPSLLISLKNIRACNSERNPSFASL